MTEEVIEKPTVAVAQRLLLVPELKEVAGMMLVTGSEKVIKEDVMQEVGGSGLGKQNGIEEKMFNSDGESAVKVERELS